MGGLEVIAHDRRIVWVCHTVSFQYNMAIGQSSWSYELCGLGFHICAMVLLTVAPSRIGCIRGLQNPGEMKM